MIVAIVAYPHLTEESRESIESFRRRYDPQASRIALHFTLVFPVETAPDELAPETEAIASSTEPIPFAMRRAVVMPDDLVANRCNIFLVPEEGRTQITNLHDRLYAGVLRPHLRLDIPFLPHITVGAAQDARLVEGWAEALHVQCRTLVGTVADIDLIDLTQHRVSTVARYVLGKAAQGGRRPDHDKPPNNGLHPTALGAIVKRRG
jgi:2'-5' RNA ligase